MKFRLRRIGVLKAAIMGGIGYALMSLLLVPFFLFFVMMAPFAGGMGHEAERMMGPVFVLMMPLIYGVIGFIGTGLAAAIYNLISMMTGGLDLELERAEPDAVTSMPPATPPLAGY